MKVLLAPEAGGQVALRLRAHPPGAIKEASQGVHLRDGDGEHDEHAEAGPEGDPPQVVLQQVAVPRLQGPQRGQDMAAPLQVLVHRVQPHLEDGEQQMGEVGLIHKDTSGESSVV